jgi:hypothetical protein
MNRNKWKEAIEEALIVSCLDLPSPTEMAEEALYRLLNWEVTIALDPAVSSEAQALIDRGRMQSTWLTEEDIKEILYLAGEDIWRSIKKWDGNPSYHGNHPIECVCSDCQ